MTEMRDGLIVSVCMVCKLPNQLMFPPPGRTYEVICERCGHFKITHEAGFPVSNQSDDQRARISEWIWQQNQAGVEPTIFEADVPLLADRPPLPFAERARRLLAFLAEGCPFPGSPIEFRQLSIDAMLQTYDPNAAQRTIDYLVGEGFVKQISANTVTLTGKGLIQAQEWGRRRIASLQGFVAMWFAAELETAWTDGLYQGVEAAGYRALRIDQKEHTNKICDEIIAEIRRSRFLVADFTGHRGGVYYEGGFAAGLGIPVFHTCRKTDMANLHFDIRQYNCIDWETPAELAQRLQRRIEAVIGDGPLKGHPKNI